MKVIGFAGWSGSGKTTLVTQLIPVLVRRGVTVSTMKHAHHAFDVDKPGKDSYQHRAAGATEVMIGSGKRWALMHELREEAEPDSLALMKHMSPVDLLIIEGWKKEGHEKIEIHRPAHGKPLIQPDDPKVVAVASDAELPGLPVPRLDLNDIEAIADFIVDHCGLAAKTAAQ
ncbi:molybdopterin-guanine dinucleotide biosynthesis protein B [Pelagibius sp.]|uniref:molybdopterin-guanine dinucleotide biosynthesis protein B n=1 Tax=Pelagibius sp. TaxID=1931238 RepID=UPI002639F31F|nr:molybdopterin-guanine dinucleotide biosynthesis protein B [Pelagibius sp.]